MSMSIIASFKINGTIVGCRGPLSDDDGLKCYSVKDFSLEKAMLRPNEFHFTLRRQGIDRTQKTIQFDIASSILAKDVECRVVTSLNGMDTVPAVLNHNQGEFELEFKGTIVSTSMEGLDIKCVALSNDYELSIIPHCNYFMNKKLEDIVKSVWTGQGRSQANIKPNHIKEIPYVVQYNETDYDFLVRLAKQYGEYFYYDETQGLVFGTIPNSSTQDLVRINDFLSVQYELTCGDPNLKYAAYHYPQEGEIRTAAENYVNGQNLYAISKAASSAVDANNRLYYDYPQALPCDANNDYLKICGYNLWRDSDGASFVVCRCTTYRLDIHVGSIIKMTEPVDKDNKYDNGELLVTAVRLSWDCNGSPVNEITAIWRSDVPPYYDVNAYPRSSAQRAIVVDNVDPLKLGRVMVRFAWQDVGQPNYTMPNGEDDRKKYPWVRIAQPYGGNDKGCYILPEVGEEVMVGFEHDNMEKPFVIGTLYHGEDKSAEKKQLPDANWVEPTDHSKNKNNEVKAFRTKKGHTIEIHDTDEGNGFIRIYGNEKKNQPNYDIILSTDKIQRQNGDNKEDYVVKIADETSEAGKDVKEKEDYKAEKLRIMVRSNGGDIMLDASDGDIIMNAKNIRVHATGSTTSLIDGKNVVKVKGEQLIDVDSNSLIVQKNQVVEIKGKDTEKIGDELSIEASKAVKFKADSLHAETTQKTEIKAASIDTKANENVNLQAETGFEVDGGTNVNLKASNINVEANIGATLKGSQVSVNAKGPTTVKGSTILIDASSGTRKGQWTDV